MSDTLVLAVPSKGRLQENAAAFFARAGLEIVQGRGARDYRGQLAGLKDVEIAFLSAADIVAQLAAGARPYGRHRRGSRARDAGRRRRESGAARRRSDLAAPMWWSPSRAPGSTCAAMADLEDVAASFRARRGARMRVATKYINLTRRFFAKMHVSDYRIVESSGATEGAPAAGQAELIVDITTTGATLAANALKILDDGVILRSQANLVASLSADWSEARARERAGHPVAHRRRRGGAHDARGHGPHRQSGACARSREAEAQFSARLRHRTADGRVTLNCPLDRVAPLADWLIAQGADHVGVAALDYVFSAANPLYERLLARLAGRQ